MRVLRNNAIEICRHCKEYLTNCSQWDKTTTLTEWIEDAPKCLPPNIKEQDISGATATKAAQNIQHIKNQSIDVDTKGTQSQEAIDTKPAQNIQHIKNQSIDVDTKPAHTQEAIDTKPAQSAQKSSKGALCLGVIPQPTKKEKIVLDLITKSHTTIKQIANKLNCKKRTIYEHIQNLRKKGLLNRQNEAVLEGGGYSPGLLNRDRLLEPENRGLPPQKPQNTVTQMCGFSTDENDPMQLISAESADIKPIEYHAPQLRITIIEKSDFYIKNYRGKKIWLDGEYIALHKNVIEIYPNKRHRGYQGKNRDENASIAVTIYQEHINRLASIIENDWKITLIKDRASNWTEVKAGHFAEVGAEIAKHSKEKQYKVKIAARDGTIWFLIDFSHGLIEAETVHSETSQHDMGLIDRYMGDWKDNNPPTLTELNTRLINLENNSSIPETPIPVIEKGTHIPMINWNKVDPKLQSLKYYK